MLKKWNTKSFIAGMVVMAFIMGATAFAQTAYKTVQISTDTVKKVLIDGREVVPPADMKPFVYNGRTYVSLRYIGDSMYKNVGWDGNTGTVTIGGVNIGDTDRNAVFAAIDRNLEHANNEDIDGYIKDFSGSVDSKTLDNLRDSLEQLFSVFDLAYTGKDMQVIAYNGSSCEVRYVVETRKTGGILEFNDNRITSVQKLVKEGGTWKLTYSYTEKSELLD